MSIPPFALWLAAALAAVEPAPGQDIVRRVDEILQQRFPSLSPEQRPDAVRRISSALALAPTPRVESLFENLHQLAGYYESVLSFHGERLSAPGTQERLVARGGASFLDQMEIVVRRAALREESAARRKAVEEQIAAIATSGQEILRDRLLGPAGARFAADEGERLEEVWKYSLDWPYKCVLDGPLSPADVECVKIAMRKAAEPFAPVLLTDEDLADPARRARLGVPRLLTAVRQAGSTMTAFGFPERADTVAREKAWIAEVQAERDKEFLAPEAIAPRSSETPAPRRKEEGVAGTGEGAQEETGMPPVRPEGRSDRSGSGRSDGAREFSLLLLLALAAVIGLLSWRAISRRSQAG